MEPLGINDVDSYQSMMDPNGRSPMDDEIYGKTALQQVMPIAQKVGFKNDMRQTQDIENKFRKKK